MIRESLVYNTPGKNADKRTAKTTYLGVATTTRREVSNVVNTSNGMVEAGGRRDGR